MVDLFDPTDISLEEAERRAEAQYKGDYTKQVANVAKEVTDKIEQQARAKREKDEQEGKVVEKQPEETGIVLKLLQNQPMPQKEEDFETRFRKDPLDI